MSNGHAHELEHYRRLLQQKRVSLEQASEAGEDGSRPVELDQARIGRVSRMGELQDQAMAQATSARRELELKKIASALARIDTGDYGACLRCGEDIPDDRLAVDPTATLCVGCAERTEER